MNRYINQIFPANLGETWHNQDVLPLFEECIAELDLGEEERIRLRDFVRFQLVGERSRRALSVWRDMDSFASRATTFERGAEQLLDALAQQVIPAASAAGVRFDAVLATTATGNLMPGIGYRMAARLGDLVRPDSLVVDLANVGCTGGVKVLNLTRSLDEAIRNILVVAVEVPSTLVDVRGTQPDLWQGNCTFGDGACALWVSNDPEQGTGALALEDIAYRQRADVGLNLIRWCYRDYYAFALEDEKTFEKSVRDHVAAALSETEAGWKEEPRWAIHPAGILLLVRLSRKLGIPQEAIQPSVQHYRDHSNQSSASILQILNTVAATTPTGSAVNLLTMGAGFNVIYGRVRKIR